MAADGEQTGPTGRKLGLRTAIVLCFFAFGLLLAGPPTWYNYLRSSETALEVAQDLIEQAGDEAQLRTRLLIEPLHFLADHASLLPGSAARLDSFEHPLLSLQLEVLTDNPQLYSTYFAEGDGGFLQAVSLAGRPAVAAKLGAPPEARFSLRLITVQAEGRLERWRHLDADRKIMGETPPRPADYDPRQRPWFVRAAQMDGTVRTDLYLFNSTGELGLTVSRRIPAGRPLVFGVDMTLESLSGFLKGERLGPSGLLFMFDSRGVVIGHPDPQRVVLRPEGGDAAQRATVRNLGDPVALAAFAQFEAGGGRPLPLGPLRVNGTEYLCQVRRVDELGGTDDFLALVARVDDFTGPLARTRNTSMFFALGLILVAVPILGFAASSFGKGLIRLAVEADRIRKLDLASTERLDSPIAEMDQLGTAVAGMRSALHSSVCYLSKSLVKQFLESGVDPVLGGERKVITLLFTDVQDFTPLAENLPPEELMQAMSQYFEAVAQAILDAGGTIDKFIGDAVMAFWNAPVEDPDHVAKACLAALRLSKSSRELNERRAAENLPLLRTRVGIHTGAAVVGNVGASDRMDYTALGANVNLASRLEGLNKFYATSILVSGEVRQRAKGEFLFRSVDVVVPKGASAAHAVFELVGALPASPHADVAAPRAMLGFCSRWERAITLYRTAQWDKALDEFTALGGQRPDDQLAAMYATRTRRLLENKQGRDWKAIMRFKDK
ncbi:MAG TPA: adenylate/guanylate cyclase domain-containing protein [Humidesulfovibrio sp.]|uniref:adenylate/guanylate cyclase domain-containing protein n=1 Tax=Humidesulfovibrio sp. TaxID=2910988 RepID=UPI002C80DEA1|nr:adenylate/guanylate cyclase domain-containing protein [Humidesulfovibrio sp.]HWR02701.1 adenylate/guanylate cyclase domain-containing protein [Humidesulfovibrio sp.]